MRVYKFMPPYDNQGNTNFPLTMKRSGVYLIKENGVLVYVGYSETNLYKTMYRHFQYWKDKQYRVTYSDKLKTGSYLVRVIFCTPAQAFRLEGALILKYRPRDNAHQYEGYELDEKDEKILSQYKETITERDAPF